MKAFGLTGNIGCGKSTVATLLLKYPDVLVFDCDKIAKEIISSDKHRKDISGILGTDVFPCGKTDFKAIANIIFGQTEKKRLFEELIHPLVWKAVQEQVELIEDDVICLVESAIIYETGSEDKFVAVIVVACNPKEQFRRIQNDRKMGCADIQARLAQQIPSSEKEARAQFVIRTDCSMKQLKDRVSDIYQKLKK